MKKRCSVCGDTHQTNVRLVWERESDHKRFDICCLCAEQGKVNAESVNNYLSTYKEDDEDRIRNSLGVQPSRYQKYRMMGGCAVKEDPKEVGKRRFTRLIEMRK